MDIVFLTNLYPKENEREIRSKMSVDMNDAANALQWNLVNGFEEQCNGELTLINRLPIYSWPKHYPEPFVKTFSFSHKEGAHDINPGFCNITGLKQYFGRKKFTKQVVKQCEKNNDSVLVMYSLHPFFLSAAKKVREKYSNIKILAIVADLPQYSSKLSGILGKAFQQNNVSRIYNMLTVVDGFVLLTDQMAEKLRVDVPYIVMEGIAPERNLKNINIQNTKGQKIRLLYTGSMNAQYGIFVLLQAFSQIQSRHMELHLCGLGNAEMKVQEYAQKDKRIIYHGKVDHQKALELQMQADILVNPRQNVEEFTKYSFPSKNLEYLSSGKPLIAYKLDGIPKEYDDYIIYPQDNTSDALTRTIRLLAMMTIEERKTLGNRARMFVNNEKNYIAQTKRILNFINSNLQEDIEHG